MSRQDKAHSVPITRTVLLIGSAFALGILLRSQIAAIPLERDEGEYAYIGQRWLQGEIPYKDTFDQKPPGAFAVYACILWAFAPSATVIHWCMQLYSLATIACVFWLGRMLYCTTVGFYAACLCAFLTTSASLLGNSANTEQFMILPIAAAMLSMIRAVDRNSAGSALLTGMLLAGAMLFKQVAFFNFVFSGVYLLIYGKRVAILLAAFLAGTLLALTPVTVYFWAKDAGPQFYDCTIGHNVHYARVMGIMDYPIQFELAMRGVLRVQWPIYACAGIAVGLAVWKWLGRPRQAIARADVTLLVWLAFSAAAIAVGGYFREHYFVQAIPPLALLAARGITDVAGRFPGLWGRLLGAVLCLAVILYGLARESWYYFPGSPAEKCRQLYGDFVFPESLAIGQYLAETSAPTDRVLIVGSEPQILCYADRKSATRYIFFYPLTLTSEDARQRQQQVLKEIREHPPKFIIAAFDSADFAGYSYGPQDIFLAVQELLRNDYRTVAVIAREANEPLREVRTDSEMLERWAKKGFWYDAPEKDWWSAAVIWERKENVE
jgi:4-amino-4-deoxy-L-arabinose transferase-like glycosyltransferase